MSENQHKTSKIAELRAKIRERKLAPDNYHLALTDDECDAMLRKLVLDAERAILDQINHNLGLSLLDVTKVNLANQSCLLDLDPNGQPPETTGDPYGK